MICMRYQSTKVSDFELGFITQFEIHGTSHFGTGFAPYQIKAKRWLLTSNAPPTQPAHEWVKGKVVGSGSFGTVHLAISKSKGSLFVVKSAHSEAGMQSLENESSILESLDSPYVVQCLGKESCHIQHGEKKLYVFIEFMSGGCISDVANTFGGILDEQVIRSYTRDILEGLKYLHRNGIVHCDIKCKNVLLGSSGHVKLADFGCAKRVDAGMANVRTSTGGTPLWMAPEVLRNERLDFALDIWSLGCTIIEMATGKAPWSDEISAPPMAAILEIAHGDKMPRFPSHFSKEGMDFLRKCVERNPLKRWNADELLNHPFVSNKFTEVKKDEKSYSPVSILDDGIFGACETEYHTSREEVQSRILPLLMKCGGSKEKPLQADFGLGSSSESWVTVRS